MNRHTPGGRVVRCTLATPVALLILGGTFLSAQTTTSVIGSGAVEASIEATRLWATVGQPAIGLTTASSSEASQGFWYVRTSVSSSTVAEERAFSQTLSLTGVPNPVSRTTLLSFHLQEKGHASLLLYNAIGQKVLTIVDEECDAGPRSVRVDMTMLPFGSYTAVLNAGDRRGTTTLLLID